MNELKYRINETWKTQEVMAEWIAANQFTVSDLDPMPEIGYEIVIVSGHGAGKAAQITNIEGSAPYTVTIDRSLGSIGGQGYVTITNYKLLKNITDGDTRSYLSYPAIGRASAWIQYKFWISSSTSRLIKRIFIGTTPRNVQP